MKAGPAAALSLSLFAVAGCASSSRTIDTPTLVGILRAVGFQDLEVISNKQRLQDLARRVHRPNLARNPLDEDTILTAGYSNPLTMPLTAVRLPSTAMAVRRAKSDRPLLTARLPPSERKLLPRAYDPRSLREVQVCNVVMTSYNRSHDRALELRFQRAASQLRKEC